MQFKRDRACPRKRRRRGVFYFVASLTECETKNASYYLPEAGVKESWPLVSHRADKKRDRSGSYNEAMGMTAKVQRMVTSAWGRLLRLGIVGTETYSANGGPGWGGVLPGKVAYGDLFTKVVMRLAYLARPNVCMVRIASPIGKIVSRVSALNEFAVNGPRG